MKEKMKFDVVVGNPPYKGNFHLKFLKIAYNISKEWVIWVHPSNWIVNRKGAVPEYQEMKNLIKGNLKEISFFNGNPLFNVDLASAFGILVINKEEIFDKIKIEDKIRNIKIFCNDIEEINKWSNPLYFKLEEKILKLANKDNFLNHKNKKEGPYFINVARVRGHVDVKNKNNLFQDDFYSLIPRDRGVEKEINQPAWFSFNDPKEANNFLSFVKSRWAMFALSIFKIGANSATSELKGIPWLDWSNPWTEELFEKLIDATPEEIEFIHKNIPNYYGTSKK